MVVQYLLEGCSDDMDVIDALVEFLQTPDEEHADIKGLEKCTGKPAPPPARQCQVCSASTCEFPRLDTSQVCEAHQQLAEEAKACTAAMV